MTTFNVRADIGTLHATVEADNPDAAAIEAVAKWDREAVDIFVAATFEVEEAGSE